MTRELLKSKIHRAVVTQAQLDYVGSLTLGYQLCQAANIVPYEFTHITNIHNGVHWVTYVIVDDQNPKTVCLNGTAARHFHPGDPVIIMAYGHYTEDERASHRPSLVFVDESNTIVEIRHGEQPFDTGPHRTTSNGEP